MKKINKFGVVIVLITIVTVFLVGCTFSYSLDSEAAEQIFGPGSEFYEKMDEAFGDGGTLDSIFGHGGEFEKALYTNNFPFFWKHFGWIIILSSILALFQLVFFILALISVLRKNVSGSEKLPWVLVIIFGSTIGCIIYFAIGNKQLNEKVHSIKT